METLCQLFVSEKVDFFFGEVDCGFDVSTQVNYGVRKAADHCREFALQGSHGSADGGAGAGFYEVGDGFCLREVDFVVEEGSLGEFTWLRAAAAYLNNTVDESFHDERATVTLQLEHVLTRVGMWCGEKEREPRIDGFLLGIEEAGEGGATCGWQLAENDGRNLRNLGSRDAHDANATSSRRR